MSSNCAQTAAAVVVSVARSLAALASAAGLAVRALARRDLVQVSADQTLAGPDLAPVLVPRVRTPSAPKESAAKEIVQVRAPRQIGLKRPIAARAANPSDVKETETIAANEMTTTRSKQQTQA